MNIQDKLFSNLLDSFTSVTLALLLVITAVMLIQHGTAARQEEGASMSGKELAEEMYQKRLAQDEKLYKEVKRLFGQRQYSAAQKVLHKVQKEHPDNPRSFIYQARLQYNTGKMVDAISSYRQAVESEPDFIDKNTPLFIGKSIMDDLTAAKEKLVREMKLQPKDKK
ncbi:MAG: tetratricopeptide repeat protein, partial [Candidatus Electrothrix sp. ATG2]|nr:tetratricopeptide repeat protein [Candidatus Electrothrix sp. ATG2]